MTEYAKLCETCSGIFRGDIRRRCPTDAWTVPYETHHESLDSLRSALKSECAICVRIWRVSEKKLGGKLPEGPAHGHRLSKYTVDHATSPGSISFELEMPYDESSKSYRIAGAWFGFISVSGRFGSKYDKRRLALAAPPWQDRCYC